MTEREANWRCQCGKVNWVRFEPAELKKKMFSCCNCGKLYGKFKVNKRNDAWLFCLPWSGIGDRSPRGVNTDAGTGEMFFGDPVDNKDLTRTDYAKKYGWDAWVMFCKQPRNKDHPACKDFESRCNKDKLNIVDDILEEIEEMGKDTHPHDL